MYLSDEDENSHDFTWMVKNSVVPRPIAWVGTQDESGAGNLAPYSYFTLVTMNPPTLMISFIGEKHSYDNIVRTGQFVVNLITEGQAEVATATAAITDASIDEAALHGLSTTPSTRIAPPRLTDARVALECELMETTTLLGANIVFGRVLAVHADDDVLDDTGRISIEKYRPVARLGGSLYTTVTTEYRHVVPVADDTWLSSQVGSTR